jgi:two-component system cell cycle response regulator DivK
MSHRPGVSGEVILLVEDNENNRYLSTFLLEREGFRIVHARSGREAVELALRERPRLILMDIQLPEMDGYQVTALLKEHASLAAVPVVGVSSYATASDRDKALASGFAGYLEKPIDPDTFGRDIARFVSSGGAP